MRSTRPRSGSKRTRGAAVTVAAPSRGASRSATAPTTVVFTVAPAAKARVSAVSVEGFPRPPALATRMDKPLDETALAADRLLIQQAALHAGYPQAEVAVEAKPGGGDVAVLFRVSLGPQAFFGVISIDAPTEVQPLIERHRSHLRTGDPYTIEAVAAERDDLVAALRNDGYAQAEVAPSVVPSGEGDRIDVVFAVQPGRQELVGRIVVAGLEHTREEVVRREITLVEGKPLGLDQLLESQRRLSALGLFRAIQIDETDADAQGRRNVVVRVRESTPTSVSYGAGYGERDNLRFSVEVTRKNLAGMNRTLSTFARWSFQTNRFLATYREPFLRNRRQDLFLSMFREEEERDSFSFRRYGTSAQTAFALGKTWNAIVRYSFQKTDTFRVQVPLDEVDRRFQQSTLSGPSVSFVKDTRDDALDPSSGHFIGMDNQLSLNVLGGDTFAKTFLQAAAYRRLDSRTVLAVAGRGGLGRAFGTSRPAPAARRPLLRRRRLQPARLPPRHRRTAGALDRWLAPAARGRQRAAPRQRRTALRPRPALFGRGLHRLRQRLSVHRRDRPRRRAGLGRHRHPLQERHRAAAPRLGLQARPPPAGKTLRLPRDHRPCVLASAVCSCQRSVSSSALPQRRQHAPTPSSACSRCSTTGRCCSARSRCRRGS